MNDAVAPAAPILVTRPGAAGRTLAEALTARGARCLWLPAFEIGPPPDPEAVRTRLAQLASFDVAVFVSPNAVRAVREVLPSWPAGPVAGAVGEGTQGAIEQAWPQVPLIAPAEASGSEPFWQVLQAHRPLHRVLILRAETGREWLLDRLTAIGCEAVALPVYRRAALAWNDTQRDTLLSWRDLPPPFVFITSSEAVDVVHSQCQAAPDLASWLQSGTVLAIHPRIVAHAAELGWRAQQAAAEPEAILAAASAQ